MKIRSIISIVLFVVSIFGLINVYSDNSDLEAKARELACPACESTLTRMERSAISQSFYLQLSASTQVVIKCQKAAIFVGAYECKKL